MGLEVLTRMMRNIDTERLSDKEIDELFDLYDLLTLQWASLKPYEDRALVLAVRAQAMPAKTDIVH